MKRLLPRYAFAAGAAIALLAGCGGGGGSSGGSSIPNLPGTTAAPSLAPPTPTPGPPAASGETLVTKPGAVIGTADAFTPHEGDTATGGQGQTVDGVACDNGMVDNYHIHFYLGIFVNGKQVATPAGLGMENPQPPDSRGFVDVATCLYHIHTHDASGLIHVEDPNPNNIPITSSMYTLKTFFDIWGITVNSSQFGPFSGPVRVFTSGQVYRGGASGGNIPATDLTFYGTDPNSIPIYSYEVIFVEIGPTYPASLPNVHFYELQ